MAGSVLLVAMPWEILSVPPLQLGTLRSVLDNAGIATQVRSFKLAFMEHCLSASAACAEADRIGTDDYHRIGREYFDGTLSDWVFAVPPFRDTTPLDQEYFGLLRQRKVPEGVVAKAVAMRALVPGFLEQCVDEILSAAPAVIGFMSPQNQFGPSAYSQGVPSLALARALKARNPAALILFGGVNCAGTMGAALHRSFPWIDVVIRSECERILPEVLQDMLEGRPIRPQPSLCYRDAPGGQSIVVPESPSSRVPMDELPVPNHDEFFERLHQTSFCAEILPKVRLQYESSRGCWWGEKSPCTFCGLNGTSMPFRSKRPEQVADDLVAMASRYGRLAFNMADTMMDAGYVQELLPRLRDLDLDLSIFFETRSNFTKEEVRLLRDGGVDRIQPGTESLSIPILRLVRKGVTGLQNVRMVKWCAEFGVQVTWNLLYGVPGEPPAEYVVMADALQSLTHLEPPRLFPIWLDRFTPYFERAADFGLEVTGPPAYARVVYPVDDAALIDLVHWFEYRRTDGSDPETYIGDTRRVIEEWTRSHASGGYRSLRYARGPDFLRIVDRRPNLPARDYTLGEPEATIYLACEDGATPAEVREALNVTDSAAFGVNEIGEFLDELTKLRLVYYERGRYLALALSMNLPELTAR